jgi:hypothetical protein
MSISSVRPLAPVLLAPFAADEGIAVTRSVLTRPLRRWARSPDDLRMRSWLATWLLVLGGLVAVFGLVLIPLPGPGLGVVVLGVPIFVVGLILRIVVRGRTARTGGNDAEGIARPAADPRT